MSLYIVIYELSKTRASLANNYQMSNICVVTTKFQELFVKLFLKTSFLKVTAKKLINKKHLVQTNRRKMCFTTHFVVNFDKRFGAAHSTLWLK